MDKIIAGTEYSVKNKNDARRQAIAWQAWQSNTNLSYAEISSWAEHFRKVGKKFGLTKEFKENGII